MIPTFIRNSWVPLFFVAASASCGLQRAQAFCQPARVVARRGAASMRFDVASADLLEVGTSLVASPDDYGHFTMRAVALLFEHGPSGSKAVLLDRGTPFEIGEMTNANLGPLAINRLYRGGEDGGDSVLMLHSHPELDGSVALGGNGGGGGGGGRRQLAIGGSGAAVAAVAEGLAPAEDFKFFSGYLSWPAGELEQQTAAGKWAVVDLPPEVALGQRSVGDMELWPMIRNGLKQQAQ